jgi:hypothetical protein
VNIHRTSTQVVAALKSLKYKGGGTATYAALDEAGAIFNSATRGARPASEAVPRVVILMTDGVSASPTFTVAAAKRLKDANVNLFTIGLGHKPLDLILMLDLTGSMVSGNYPLWYASDLLFYLRILPFPVFLNFECLFSLAHSEFVAGTGTEQVDFNHKHIGTKVRTSYRRT